MKRVLWISLLAMFGLTLAASAFARREVVIHRGPHRNVVVVHRGFPIHRRLPVVQVRPHPGVFIATTVFLAPVVWTERVVMAPVGERLVWENSERLVKDEDWTDFSLGVNDRGTKLYLQVAGHVQLNFAEVVFADGETRVVDFNERAQNPGVYSLLDFAAGRKVSHVRFVARAKSEEAKIVLRMEK